jgi:hypothetical protein
MRAFFLVTPERYCKIFNDHQYLQLFWLQQLYVLMKPLYINPLSNRGRDGDEGHGAQEQRQPQAI